MARILIVDDEVIVRKWLQLIFQPFAAEFYGQFVQRHPEIIRRFAARFQSRRVHKRQPHDAFTVFCGDFQRHPAPETMPDENGFRHAFSVHKR